MAKKYIFHYASHKYTKLTSCMSYELKRKPEILLYEDLNCCMKNIAKYKDFFAPSYSNRDLILYETMIAQ